MQNRENALSKWLEETLNSAQFSISLLTGDASFRRYFRLHHRELTQIIMDAPPKQEALDAFIDVADILRNTGIRVPQIHALDKEQGFAILEDFGDSLLLQILNQDNADRLYLAAIDTLNLMQKSKQGNLPSFNREHILYELGIFKEWFLEAYLKIKLTSSENELLTESFSWLVNEILEEPQVFIHRDYHSRNIMLLAEEKLGVIDFQDAMQGPLTYDLVSLLKDCYIQWSGEKINTWLSYFYHHNSLAQQFYSFSAFVNAFENCGLQRHLKILGIFSRLYLRDSKPNYLQDLPLTLHYVMACLESHEELKDFYQFMQSRIRLP